MLSIRHFINNVFVAAGEGGSFESLNPADNQPVARMAAARAAFDSGPWPRLPAAARARHLRRIGALIETRTPVLQDRPEFVI